ncbi:unnamed protein product [Staurois parvus]|uniref:Uncharacterized protein n=1 Tax=Staurois parvus TaxID=386267 RepID=A0ABN9HNB4_9NEOB|nr:unnamed protein product [Staurois parvus]
MCPLQHPRPSPPADSGFHVLVPVTSGYTAPEPVANLKVLKISFFFKTIITYISHTFCPYCFVLCSACILTVLSAWKLRKVHGVQKASL